MIRPHPTLLNFNLRRIWKDLNSSFLIGLINISVIIIFVIINHQCHTYHHDHFRNLESSPLPPSPTYTKLEAIFARRPASRLRSLRCKHKLPRRVVTPDMIIMIIIIIISDQQYCHQKSLSLILRPVRQPQSSRLYSSPQTASLSSEMIRFG